VFLQSIGGGGRPPPPLNPPLLSPYLTRGYGGRWLWRADTAGSRAEPQKPKRLSAISAVQKTPNCLYFRPGLTYF